MIGIQSIKCLVRNISCSPIKKHSPILSNQKLKSGICEYYHKNHKNNTISSSISSSIQSQTSLSFLSFSSSFFKTRNISSERIKEKINEEPINSTILSTESIQQTEQLEGIRSWIPNALEKLGEIFPTESYWQAFHWIHDTTGLPWWTTIAAIGLTTRVLFWLPLSLIADSNQKVGENSAVMALRNAVFQSKDVEVRKRIIVAYNKMLEQKGFRKWKSLVPALSVIITFPISVSIRSFCEIESLDGTLWFPDLSVADPLWRLPYINGILTALIVYFAKLPTNRFGMAMRYLSYGLCYFSIQLTSGLPQANHIFWISLHSVSLLRVIWKNIQSRRDKKRSESMDFIENTFPKQNPQMTKEKDLPLPT